ncbi:uncharacterized protein LOC110346718 [Heterocephalus glaber]|uniref:Uncharacterized protein LOC110346718 n=1 Tax=Heterocephalus glaber TaxID=10181 RepID=A0AAX6S5L2_HETGA|nr:uncharacterized protein LOC110346718 [Heterocephalus glaber]
MERPIHRGPGWRGGDSGRPGWAAGRRVRSVRTLPLQTRAEGRVPPSGARPRARPRDFSGRYLLARSVLAAAAPPPARPRQPDASLAPPQPADPRSGATGSPGPPPCQSPRPLVAVSGPQVPLHPLRLGRPAPFAGFWSQTQVDPALSPIGPLRLQPLARGTCPFPGRARHLPAGEGSASLGALEGRSLLGGNTELSFRSERSERRPPLLFALLFQLILKSESSWIRLHWFNLEDQLLPPMLPPRGLPPPIGASEVRPVPVLIPRALGATRLAFTKSAQLALSPIPAGEKFQCHRRFRI